MSLDPLILADGFANLGQPADASSAAMLVGQIYARYAADAEDPAGNPLIKANTTAFSSALIRWLSGRYPDAQAAAMAFSYAIEQYWQGATFSAKKAPLGVTSGGNGAMASITSSEVTDVLTARLDSAITSLNLTTLQSVASACSQFSSALHKGTTSGVYIRMSGKDSDGVATVMFGNPR